MSSLDHGATGVDLKDQRLAVVVVGAVDRGTDLRDDDLVEQPVHLQHVDLGDLDLGGAVVLGGGRLGEHRCDADGGEHGDQ